MPTAPRAAPPSGPTPRWRWRSGRSAAATGPRRPGSRRRAEDRRAGHGRGRCPPRGDGRRSRARRRARAAARVAGRDEPRRRRAQSCCACCRRASSATPTSIAAPGGSTSASSARGRRTTSWRDERARRGRPAPQAALRAVRRVHPGDSVRGRSSVPRAREGQAGPQRGRPAACGAGGRRRRRRCTASRTRSSRSASAACAGSTSR